MKKLYRRGAVHPSPPVTTNDLSFLPSAILTLAAALSSEEKEVLAYLISRSANDFGNFSTHRTNTAKKQTNKTTTISSRKSGHDHPPLFTCDCFRCYMSYWVRWDTSPNRQLIHQIIDAFEDGLTQSKKKKGKKDKKKMDGDADAEDKSGGLKRSELSLAKDDSSDSNSVRGSSSNSGDLDDYGEETEKGSVRRFVNFVFEGIWTWNLWDQRSSSPPT